METCRINVRLKPNAKHESVSVSADHIISVSVNAPPVDGKANERAVFLLSKILHLSKSSCSILKGHTSKNKLFEINGLKKDSVISKLTSSQNI
jgi:uncharacterized protein (TIGR00251 family)